MATMLDELLQAAPPPLDDIRLARESIRWLAELAGANDRGLSLLVRRDDGPEETITIPPLALRLLDAILAGLAEGDALATVPIHWDLTVSQAADLIDVPPSFLIEQLDRGAIPSRGQGADRQLPLRELIAYKQRLNRDRLRALDELVAQAQELAMGY